MNLARALFWLIPGAWALGAAIIFTLWSGGSLTAGGWGLVSCLVAGGVLCIRVGFLRLFRKF